MENKELVPRTKVAWQIIEKHEYSEKKLSIFGGIPTKLWGYVYILQHQVTGKIQFKKVILTKVRVYNETTKAEAFQDKLT